MNESNQNIFMFILVLSLGMVVGFTFGYYSANTKTEQVSNNYKVYSYEGDYPFLTIAQEFARNHKYSEDYKCMNYSRDLKNIYDSIGILSFYVVGDKTNETGSHMWLKVCSDIEPQYGELIDYSEKYNNSRIVDSNYTYGG